jgi:hypothetical protein
MPSSDGRVPAIPQNHIRESPGPERGVFPRGVAATGIDGHFEQTLILVAERDSTFDAAPENLAVKIAKVSMPTYKNRLHYFSHA